LLAVAAAWTAGDGFINPRPVKVPTSFAGTAAAGMDSPRDFIIPIGRAAAPAAAACIGGPLGTPTPAKPDPGREGTLAFGAARPFAPNPGKPAAPLAAGVAPNAPSKPEAPFAAGAAPNAPGKPEAPFGAMAAPRAGAA